MKKQRFQPDLKTLLTTVALLLPLAPADADDTDVYLAPSVSTGSEPLVMFTLDYRPNLTSTVCGGSECDDLIAEGYLPASGPYNFFQLLRAVLMKVLDPLAGVKIGFMINHDNNCTGSTTAGPDETRCSNGAYVLYGFQSMSAGSDDPGTYQTAGEDANKIALFDKLDALPDPAGTLSHPFQGKELYLELFRYLTGQDVYNGHLGYKDFGDTDRTSNLDADFPAFAWDTGVETTDARTYLSPLEAAGACTRMFVINLMFQVSAQEDDSDDAINASKADGGMEGIDLSGRKNNFDTVVAYLNDADLGDGTYGTVSDHEGMQNVLSYFIVDPTKLNTTTHGYADAGGTALALALSDDPDELVETLSNIFQSILSVSTTFVAPSVPVNVFNRSRIVNEVFMAIFEAEEDGLPRWDGNLKKLRIAPNATTGELELQDANGFNAIDIDGRIKREALTFWTAGATLPAPVDDEIAGVDGRAVARGGGGQMIPGFVSGGPQALNATAGGRKLYTDAADGSATLVDVDADSAAADELWAAITAKWSPAASDPDYGSATATERTKALNILRFARGLQDDGVTTREWLLADPLHSRPRPINYGALGSHDSTNPDIRVLMGTNDGVMHMFRNTATDGSQDGSETWGFMPRTVIPVLDRLRTNLAGTPVHPIGADASPVVYRLDVNGDGTLNSADGDKVHAYFGLRRGGKGLYALDVSNPDAPSLLWRIEKTVSGDFDQLAQTWSMPNLGYVNAGSGIIPVLVFGGGYDGDDDGDDAGDLGKDAKNRATRAGTTPAVGSDDDEGNAIFIVNALDGTLVWKAADDTSSGYDATTSTYSRTDLDDSFAANTVAVDTSGNGLLDRVYLADTGGRVWRVDLADYVDHDSDTVTAEILVTDDPAYWTATPLLSVGRHVTGHTTIQDDRRFFNAVDVARTRDSSGPFDALIIASGDREDPNGIDVNDFIYMVKDRFVVSGSPPSTTLEHADLADLSDNCLQDASCTTPPDVSNGWRVALPAAGEKGLSDTVTIGGQIFLTTFTPASGSSSCGLSEGSGNLYALALHDATAVINFDTTNDADGITHERVQTLASGGIPVQVVPLNEGNLLVQGQGGGDNILKLNVRTGFKTYWHETFH